MDIKYKIKFLTFYESWFNKNDIKTLNGLSLFCYRNSFINTNNILFIKKTKYTLINDLKKAKEKLFSELKSNTRNEIRKVDKLENFLYKINEITIYEFVEFYNVFAKEKRLSLMTKERISKYGNNLFFISGYLDNELTNIQVYIEDKKNKVVRLLHSVSTIHGLEDKARRNNIAWINRYLHWKSIENFIDNNYEIFDWGGYGNDESNKALAGIDKFKKSFAGELYKLYDYYSMPFYILTKIKIYIK